MSELCYTIRPVESEDSLRDVKKSLQTQSGQKNDGKDLLTDCKKILTLVDRAFIADKLSVSESTISQWVSDVRPIPAIRQIEILKAAKYFFKKQREIEDYVDALLLMQFGGQDPGVY